MNVILQPNADAFEELDTFKNSTASTYLDTCSVSLNFNVIFIPHASICSKFKATFLFFRYFALIFIEISNSIKFVGRFFNGVCLPFFLDFLLQ